MLLSIASDCAAFEFVVSTASTCCHAVNAAPAAVSVAPAAVDIAFIAERHSCCNLLLLLNSDGHLAELCLFVHGTADCHDG